MIKLLQYRAALLSVMFGLFGNGLSTLLAIGEMSGYYTALASLIALVVNLLVSFLLKGRWSTALKNKVKVFCLVLFAGLIVTGYLHTSYFIQSTFTYADFDGKEHYYVKGDDQELTAAARAFLQENPLVEPGPALVEFFGGPAGKDKIWKATSIRQNTLKLITSYSLIVIFFVGLISVLIEVLMGHYGKTTVKTLEPV